MEWLEISIDALVIVLLLAILIIAAQLKNLLNHMMSSLQRNVYSASVNFAQLCTEGL